MKPINEAWAVWSRRAAFGWKDHGWSSAMDRAISEIHFTGKYTTHNVTGLCRQHVFLGWFTSKQGPNVGYPRDGSVQVVLRAATLRQKMQIKVSSGPTSPSTDPKNARPWQRCHWNTQLEVLVWMDRAVRGAVLVSRSPGERHPTAPPGRFVVDFC